MKFSRFSHGAAQIQNVRHLLNIRPNEKISEFHVTGLKTLGRVCTHIFF